MSDPEFNRYKPMLSTGASCLLIGYGFYKVLMSCFNYPPGQVFDKALLFQIGLGLGYVFCGLYLLIEKTKFEIMAVIFFAAFVLEISQIGVY